MGLIINTDIYAEGYILVLHFQQYKAIVLADQVSFCCCCWVWFFFFFFCFVLFWFFWFFVCLFLLGFFFFFFFLVHNSLALRPPTLNRISN